MAGTHRSYTEDDKATALAALQANGGNLWRTARELGIPLSTLRDWNNGEGLNRAVVEKREQKKEDLDSLFEQAARVYLEHATSKAVIRAASGKDAMVAAATAVDKMRLLREQPTSITSHELTDQQRLDRLRELAERIRARRLGLDDASRTGGMGLAANGDAQPDPVCE